MTKGKIERYERRKDRVRAKVAGHGTRLNVFRSNTHIYAQIIDGETGKTLLSGSDLKAAKAKKVEKAFAVGEELAKKAVEKKIKKVVFDRNGFRYHGRIKALADGARKGGLEF